MTKASREQRLYAKLGIPTKIFTALLKVEQRNTLPDDTPRGHAWLRSEQRNDFLLWFVKICRRRVHEEFVDDHGRRTVEQIRFTCIATLFSAVSYMDRVLSKIYVEKFEFAKIQPVLVACLLLASKIHDGQEIGVWRKILEHVEDNMTEFTVEELLEYETRILLELDLKLDEPNIVDFMKLQQICMQSKMGKSCAHLFAILLLFEPQFLYSRRPSVLATAIMTFVYPDEGFCTWFGPGIDSIEEVENEVAKLLNILVIGWRAKGSEPLKWAPPVLLKVTDRKIQTMCADLLQAYEQQPVVEETEVYEESGQAPADDEALVAEEEVPLPAPKENGRKRRRPSVKGAENKGVEKMDAVQEKQKEFMSSAGKRVKKLADGGGCASNSTVPPEFTPPKTSVSNESMNSMSAGAVVELVKTGAQSPSNCGKKYYQRK